mgnify:CR=1 FL=1
MVRLLIILYIFICNICFSQAKKEVLEYKSYLTGSEKIMLQMLGDFGDRIYTTVSDIGIDTLKDYTALKNYTGHSKLISIRKSGISGLFKKTSRTGYVYGMLINGYERVYDGSINVKWFGAVGDGTVHFLSEKYSSLAAVLNDYTGLGLVSGDLNTKTIDEVAFWYGMKSMNGTYHYFNSAFIPAPSMLYIPSGVYVFNDGIKSPITSIIGDNAIITANSNTDLFKIDATNGAFNAKFENIGFAFCKSVLNSWNSTPNAGIVSYFTFKNCYFENLDYAVKYNFTPNNYINFNDCQIENANLFKGYGDFIGINGLIGSGKLDLETPFIYLGGKDTNEAGGITECMYSSILDVDGLKISPLINTAYPSDSIYTYKRVWIYTNTGSDIRISHSRFGGEGAGNPLIMVDSCISGLFTSSINVSSTLAYSTDRPPIILNGSVDKVFVSNDCTLSYIGQFGRPVYVKNVKKYLTENFGCEYPIGSTDKYVSFLDINVPDWFCSNDLLYLKKYLKNNNQLPNSFNWFSNSNGYSNISTNCTTTTVTNFGVDYNKVTATTNNALNYASYNVAGLGLPANQTVYCTIKYKGKCNNALVQIITNISGTDKYEQIRLNNTEDGYGYIRFPIYTNFYNIRIINEMNNGETFEFDSPKFSYF